MGAGSFAGQNRSRGGQHGAFRQHQDTAHARVGIAWVQQFSIGPQGRFDGSPQGCQTAARGVHTAAIDNLTRGVDNRHHAGSCARQRIEAEIALLKLGVWSLYIGVHLIPRRPLLRHAVQRAGLGLNAVDGAFHVLDQQSALERSKTARHDDPCRPKQGQAEQGKAQHDAPQGLTQEAGAAGWAGLDAGGTIQRRSAMGVHEQS